MRCGHLPKQVESDTEGKFLHFKILSGVPVPINRFVKLLERWLEERRYDLSTGLGRDFSLVFTSLAETGGPIREWLSLHLNLAPPCSPEEGVGAGETGAVKGK